MYIDIGMTTNLKNFLEKVDDVDEGGGKQGNEQERGTGVTGQPQVAQHHLWATVHKHRTSARQPILHRSR